MKSAAQLHWDYFLLLEKDLIAISETLELSEDNYDAYGPRLVQLILAAGSELDVALKSLALAMCPEHDAATNNQPNICHFKYMLIEYAQDQFATASVKFLRSEIVLTPWASLKDGPNCVFDWWASYNNIKHKRAEHYGLANLKTALELVGALFVVDAYISEVTLEPHHGFTQIVDWDSHKHMPQLEQYYAAK